MNKTTVRRQAEILVGELLENLSRVKYGEVVLTLKVHNSRVKSIKQSVENTTIEPGFLLDDIKEESK